MNRIFDFQEEENILIEKATRRKEEEFVKEINKRKDYSQHRDFLRKYFIRMSCTHKELFLLQLVDNLTNYQSIIEIGHCLCLGDVKAFVYTSADPQTNFIHDKMVDDHDRMLTKKALEEVIESDLQWYKSLQGDQQVDIIIALIKRSGGNIQKNVYLKIFKKFFAALRGRYRESKETNNAPETNAVSKITLNETEEGKDSAFHPETIEMECQRKNWDQLISEYRQKVTAMGGIFYKTKEKGKDKNKDKDKTQDEKKGKKLKEKEDKKKKKDSQKSGESKKSDKGINTAGIDWIQLLPVWLVKKIFNYFDQKTLQKIKNVNPYWSYIVQEIINERNLRIQLDKEIQTLKDNIDPQLLEDALKAEDIAGPIRKDRKRVNYERGAIIKQLRPKTTNTLVDMSLLADTMNGISVDYFPGQIVSFPREVIAGTPLYRYKPCFLKDTEVKLGTQEDLKEQESFVTYSLSTQSSSLILSVDRQTLLEWQLVTEINELLENGLVSIFLVRPENKMSIQGVHYLSSYMTNFVNSGDRGLVKLSKLGRITREIQCIFQI